MRGCAAHECDGTAPPPAHPDLNFGGGMDTQATTILCAPCLRRGRRTPALLTVYGEPFCRHCFAGGCGEVPPRKPRRQKARPERVAKD